VLERRLWIAVLRAQRDLGISVPDQAVDAYESVVDRVDLVSIRARERVTRHDVKARIEEFCALAGTRRSTRVSRRANLTGKRRADAAARRVAGGARSDRRDAGAARRAGRAIRSDRDHGSQSHVPAQVTTLGKRFANAGEELLQAYARIEHLLEVYPLRGLKGPVGTQQDQLDLLGGDLEKVAKLEAAVAKHLGSGTC